MKLEYYFSTKRCILLGVLFWLLGSVICIAGASMAHYKTENMQYPGKTPWYQTVHVGSDDYTMLGITFENGSVVGLGNFNNRLFFSGSIGASFSGSRIGNESQLTMDFTVLNGNDSQSLHLKKGDILDVAIEIHSGTVNVNIQKTAELSESTEPKKEDKSIKFAPLYRKRDLTEDTCQLEIPEDGIYEVSVTGQGASGSAHIVKR